MRHRLQNSVSREVYVGSHRGVAGHCSAHSQCARPVLPGLGLFGLGNHKRLILMVYYAKWTPLLACYKQRTPVAAENQGRCGGFFDSITELEQKEAVYHQIS